MEIKREQFHDEIKRLRGEILIQKQKLQRTLQRGYYNLNLSYGFSGKHEIRYLSLFAKKFSPITLKVAWSRKLGVEVPRFHALEYPDKGLMLYGFAETSIYLDHAIKYFRQSFSIILTIAEIEGELFKLAFEFQKLKRRINALEDLIIPRLESNIHLIENVLEDLEREEYIQMKEIKKRLVTQSQEL